MDIMDNTLIGIDEFDELRDKLEPIILQFAERHFHGVSLKIEFEFGTVTIEV